jgi:G:T-mismatch repair DNA endonuclease (very short patch repair protein)
LVRICSVKGCDNKYKSNKYCSKHVQAWRKYGDPLGHADPEETKRKQSKPKSKEHKAKQSKTVKAQYDAGERVSPMKDRQHTQEAKNKVSKANKGKPSWNKGRTTPESVTQKISKTRLERIKEGKIISSRKGKTHTSEANEKNRKAHLGKKHSEQTLEKMRIQRNTPEAIQNNRDRFAKQTKGKNKETVPEKLLQKICKDIGIKFIKQHNVKLGFQNHDIDVFIEPNICLEADGDRIHANPNSYLIPSRTSTLQPGYKPNDVIFGKSKSRKEPQLAKDIWKKDKKINTKLEELGYIVLRFWHSELETNREKCIKEILKLIKKT